MRIAILCPYSLDLPGGVATNALGFARWAARQGHEVRVVAPGTGPVEVDGVEVCLLGRAVGLPFNGSTAHLALAPRQARRARRLVTGADRVLVHEPLTPGVGFAVARTADNLTVIHHASFDVSGPGAALLRWRASWLPRRHTVAVSTAAAQTALAVTGERDIAVVPNAIELPPAPVPTQGWRGGSRPRVGFLGRVDDPRKGYDVFRAVAEQARAAGLDAEFISAGPGQAAAAHLGRLTEKERARYLAFLDILLAPNTGGESFGLVLVEALAAGCDVVASDLPGFREVLAQAGLGRCFTAGNTAAALTALREAASAFPDNLRAHEAAQRWSWDAVGPLLMQQMNTVPKC